MMARQFPATVLVKRSHMVDSLREPLLAARDTESVTPNKRQKMRPLVIVVTSVLCSMACACTQRAVPTIVINHWWNLDYAKSLCALVLSHGGDDPGLKACQERQAGDVHEFELELSTQLASREDCSGIRVLGLSEKDVTDNRLARFPKDYWDLSLNYSRRESQRQQWLLLSPHSNAAHKGEDDSRGIASVICAIVKGRGASVDE
jgi:hypothetical protein